MMPTDSPWLARLMRLLGGRLARKPSQASPVSPPIVEKIVVDWSDAPADAVEWRFDAKTKRAYWLNGKHTIEEYGIIWECSLAPSFGATSALSFRKTPADEAQRQRHTLDKQTPQASKTPSSHRL